MEGKDQSKALNKTDVSSSYYELLTDYLEEKGFYESDYSGIIYWHHEKCPDVLVLDSNGYIYYYSCPPELFGKELGLKRDEKGDCYIGDKNDVDILYNALNSYSV